MKEPIGSPADRFVAITVVVCNDCNEAKYMCGCGPTCEDPDCGDIRCLGGC